jgi:signal transduction histidine kinase
MFVAGRTFEGSSLVLQHGGTEVTWVFLLRGDSSMETRENRACSREQRRRINRRSDDWGPGGRAELCHDLREPAATIVMLADAAAQESGDPLVVRRRLRQIQAQAHWLAALLESGSSGDEPRLLDVGALVKACLEHIALNGQDSPTVEVAVGLALVEVSPIALRRAVSNVIGNAARAAGPDGALVVRIAHKGDFVAVEVDDDGPGFGRIPTVHGVGLDITDAALRFIGGGLEISAVPSGGTRVCLRIPLSPSVSAREG